MEQVIDFEKEASPRSFRSFWIVKKLIFISCAVAAAHYGIKGIHEGKHRFYAARDAYVAEVVAERLSHEKIKYDDNTKAAKFATAMSRDELLRALYVAEMLRRDAEGVVSHIREVVSYAEVELVPRSDN